MAPAHSIDAVSRDVARALLDLRVRLGELALASALGDRVADLSRLADAVDRLDASMTCVKRLKVSLGITDAECDAECLLLEQVAVKTGRMVDALRTSVEHLSTAEVGGVRRFVARAGRVVARALRGLLGHLANEKWKSALAIAFVGAMYVAPPHVQIDAEMSYPVALMTFASHALVRPFCELLTTDAAMGVLFSYFAVRQLMGLSTMVVAAPTDRIGWHWVGLHALLYTIGCSEVERAVTGGASLLAALATKIMEVGDWRSLWRRVTGAFGSSAETIAPVDPRVQRVMAVADAVNDAFRDRGVLATVARAGLGILASLLTAHASAELRSEDAAAVDAFRGRMLSKDNLEAAVVCDVDAMHALRAIDRLMVQQAELLGELGVPTNLPSVPRQVRPMPVVVVRDAPRVASAPRAGIGPADEPPPEQPAADGAAAAAPVGHARASDAQEATGGREPRGATRAEWCRALRRAFDALDEGAHGINPRTGRSIKKGGPTYRKLADACGVVGA